MIRFAPLEEDHLELVLRWRSSPDVTRYMLTDFNGTIADQKKWFARVSQDERFRYWVIFFKDDPIGVINLAGIDHTHKHCSAGYYIGKLEYRQLGAMIPPYIYNYVFNELKFRKIYGEVMAENKKVLQMHDLHGFKRVGTYKDQYFKNGRFCDVVLIELLSESWAKQKRYHRAIAPFKAV